MYKNYQATFLFNHTVNTPKLAENNQYCTLEICISRADFIDTQSQSHHGTLNAKRFTFTTRLGSADALQQSARSHRATHRRTSYTQTCIQSINKLDCFRKSNFCNTKTHFRYSNYFFFFLLFTVILLFVFLLYAQSFANSLLC